METEADSFCAVPWVQVSTKPNGSLRMCCLMNTDRLPSRGLLRDPKGRVLNAGTDSIGAATNASELKNIRRQMLSGERPVECETCWQKERLGLGSKRTMVNKSYAGDFTLAHARKRTLPDGTTDVTPSYFDLRFGNLCNLRCVMCHPSSSSQWYDDYGKLWGVDHFNDSGAKLSLANSEAFNWHANENFWLDLESRLNDIRQLYLVGGEPMLIERHFQFLELCVHRGVAAQITLEYDTNLTRLSERALALWSNFRRVILRVSIDDFGNRNDYIRFPSKWHIVAANLAQIRRHGAPLEVSVTTTWQVLNVLSITDFWRALGFVTSTRILNTPAYMDVAILPADVKNQAIAKLETFIAKRDVKNWEKASAYVRYLRESLDRSDPEKVEQFIDVIKRLDILRGTDWQKSFPELAPIFSARNGAGIKVSEAISPIVSVPR